MARPPEPITTERLVLREASAQDRPVFVELLGSSEVHAYLGGPRGREDLERRLPPVPAQWPGSFIVNLVDTVGEMIGLIRWGG